MKLSYFLFGFSLLLATAFGCQKQSDIPDSPVAPAPPVVQDPGLDEYAKKLAPILAARIKASEKWGQAIQSISPNDPDFGPVKFGPITDDYARAVDQAESDLKRLKPPPAAIKVHQAFDRLFTRLGNNLDSTVAAMKGDGDENMKQLESERKQITSEGALDLKLALESGGFDVQLFSEKGELRKVR